VSKKKFGLCRLTGKSGQYVESHILPKALTRPERPGLPLTQGGKGQRPIRRWSSWTDTGLVIRKGEDILEELDTWAIAVLRAQQLVWSGWGDAIVLPATQTAFDSAKRGFRTVDGIETGKMRLFLLSLLWRAAASDIPEMSEIVLPDDDLQTLGSLLLERDPGPIAFYPAHLIQLSTRGLTHNHAPIASVKIIPSFVEGVPDMRMSIFRFYFDGLIVHFHCHANDDGYTTSLGELVVGASRRICVTTVPYDISFQHKNLSLVMGEAEAEFGDVLSKLAWPPRGR